MTECTQTLAVQNGGLLVLPPYAKIMNTKRPVVSHVDDIQAYDLGTKYCYGDRIYRYCKASGTCYPEIGTYKPKKTNTCTTAPTQTTAAALAATYPAEILAAGAIGSRFVTVTIDTTIGVQANGKLYKDELAGGLIVIGNGSAQHPQMRFIVGHAALTSTGGSLDIELDEPLIAAVTASTTTIELMESKYYNIKADGAGGEYVTYFGVPAAPATSGQFLWVQTKGGVWITSDTHTCDSAMDRMVVFVGNGSVVSAADVTVENGFNLAGHAIDMSGSGSSNAPFVDLMLDS